MTAPGPGQEAGGDPLGGPLWDFALAVYMAPGVSTACLELQERFGVDVNLLLFSAWMGGARGVDLSAADVAGAQALVRAWHAEIVKPLRTVRQALKAGPDPAPSERTETLRNKIKAVEVHAERIELSVLQDHGLTVGGAPSPERNPERAARNMTLVVDHFARTGLDAAARDEVAVVARAIGPERTA